MTQPSRIESNVYAILRHCPDMIDIPRPRRGYTAAYHHAVGRLVTRYDLYLTQTEYILLCQQLAAGTWHHEVQRRAGAGRVQIKFRLKGKRVFAVWDRAAGVIVTFLPPDRQGYRMHRQHRHHRHHRKPKGGSNKRRWETDHDSE